MTKSKLSRDDQQVELLARAQCSVSQCPESISNVRFPATRRDRGEDCHDFLGLPETPGRGMKESNRVVQRYDLEHDCSGVEVVVITLILISIHLLPAAEA